MAVTPGDSRAEPVEYVLDPYENPRPIDAEGLSHCALAGYRSATMLYGTGELMDEVMITLPDGSGAWLHADDLAHAIWGIHGSAIKHFYRCIWGKSWPLMFNGHPAPWTVGPASPVDGKDDSMTNWSGAPDADGYLAPDDHES